MTNENTAGPAMDMNRIEELVRSIGVVVSNTFLYGENHGVTTEAIDRCFVLTTEALTAYEKLTLMRTDDELSVNNKEVEQKNPLVASLIERLGEVGISNITLAQGLDRREFDTLVGVLTAKPDEIEQLGGLAEVLRQFNVQHIQTRAVSYIAIDEQSEEVIAKKTREDMEAEAAADRDAVTAFLKGAEGLDGSALAEGLQHVGSDSDAMSRIIVEVADARQKLQAGAGGPDAEGGQGEDFAGLVSECVRKAYGELMKTPGLKTQKAKKELTKTLAALEEQLLNRMREVCQEVSDDDRDTVNDAIEGLIDELKIDSLASEYMKKRNAIEANEQKILRYLKAKGLDQLADMDLESKLAEAGLTKQDWQRLLIKSGISGGGRLDEDSAMAAVGHIAILMAGLDKASKKAVAAGGVEDAAAVAETVAEVGRDVTTLVTGTGQKIEKFVQDVCLDQAAADAVEAAAAEQGKGPKLTRRKILELLAEIVQELCQPLSVINATVGMLQSGRLGTVSETQGNMLKLADESGQKLQVLVDNLLEISGLPETLSPDERIQSSLYG